MIKSVLFSSDKKLEISFDATPWFEQASSDEIQELVLNKFGGCRKAIEVAEFMAVQNPRIADIFIYVHNKSKVDYVVAECYMNHEDALDWVYENHPELEETA